jgi:hypothetical protein
MRHVTATTGEFPSAVVGPPGTLHGSGLILSSFGGQRDALIGNDRFGPGGCSSPPRPPGLCAGEHTPCCLHTARRL